ncbi:MAG: FecR family protein [Rhodoferax sp.]
MLPIIRAALLGAFLAGGPAAARAQDTAAIGRVQQAQGLVTVARGAAAQIADGGTELQAGDVVETQAGSAAVLRYRDGTQVQLAGQSRFTVSRFVQQPEQPEQEAFAARLLKGAMRVLTGSIAQRRADNTRFAAGSATIGIRGTDFSVRLCEDDCRLADAPTVAAVGLPELAGRVGAAAGGVSAIDARGLWRALPVSSALRAGDRVITGESGLAILVLTDGTRIGLEPGARLHLREVRWDPARPEAGRIAFELLAGSAQVTTGQLAKRRPERFVFLAGDQLLRFHGTSIGARVVQAAGNAVDSARDTAQDTAANAQQGAADAVNAATGAGAAAAAAMRAAAAPVLQAMTAQLEALRNNPPTTEAQRRAAYADAETLSARLLTAVGAPLTAPFSLAATDEQRAELAALYVLRWQFQLAITGPIDIGTTTAGTAVGPPFGTAVTLPLLQSELTIMRNDANARRGLAAVGLDVGDLDRLIALAIGQTTALLGAWSVRDLLTQETGGYFQARNDDASRRLLATAQSVGDAARTVITTALAASRQIVGQVSQQAAQGTQQAGQQAAQATQQASQQAGAALAALRPDTPSGPPGPGYDITGGQVAGPTGLQTVVQGRFNTVIVEQGGQEPKPEGGGYLVRYREAIVPPTEVRTADGQVLTQGTVLREVRYSAFGQMEGMLVTFQGLQFAPASGRAQPPGVLATACAECTGLLASGFDVVPSEMARGEAAVAANNARGGSGTAGAADNRPVQVCGAGGAGGAPCTSTNAPNAGSGSAVVVAVMAGAVTSTDRDGGGSARIEAGQAAGSTPRQVKAPVVYGGRLRPVGPAVDEAALSVDTRGLFGVPVGLPTRGGGAATDDAAGAGTASAGVYVHVQDGAVALAQDGQEIVLGRGESAVAPAAGGPPARVLRGVQVLAPALRDAIRLATQGRCGPDDRAAPPAGPMTALDGGTMGLTASLRELGDLRWQGTVAGKPVGIDGDTAGGAGRPGAGGSGGSAGGAGGGTGLGGDRWGPGFSQGALQDLTAAARGAGLSGAGRLQGAQNRVGGRFADTFAGNQVNDQGGDVTLGGRPGRIGNLGGSGDVSSGGSANAGDRGTGFAFGASVLAGMLIQEGGTPTGDTVNDALELSYAQSVGPDGYAATKNLSPGDRAAYWGAERDRQMVGGGRMSAAEAQAERNRQQTGNQENPDDCASCGGNGLPVFLRAGQFGIAVRGVERAVASRIQRAGGAGDGRGDAAVGGGSGGGVAMTRQQQAGGTVRVAQTGTLNLDAALKINQLVNPGAR